MAKNHSDDSTSSSRPAETHGSLGANGLTSADMDLTGMGENMMSETGYHPASTGQPGSLSTSPSPAQEAARAAQSSATKTSTRSSTERRDSPMSMAKKKGNQPR